MDTVFEQVIKSHLDERSHTDELFATKYSNPKKSIKECCDYIDSQARKALVPVHESSASPKKERSKRNKVIEKESPFVQLSLFEES